MTKATNYLATVTDVNSEFPAKGAAIPNSNRCVIKDQTGQTIGSVGATNNWYVDESASPFVTYTSPRLPRWQDLVQTTTTTTTILLNCNFTFSTLQVPATTTTTTTINCPDPLTINDFNVTGPQSVPRGSTRNYTFTAAGSLATFPQTYTISATGTLTPFTPITWIISSPSDPTTRVEPVTWQNGISTQNSVSIKGVNCGVYDSTISLQVSTV